MTSKTDKKENRAVSRRKDRAPLDMIFPWGIVETGPPILMNAREGPVEEYTLSAQILAYHGSLPIFG